jgi:hypothetical protein
MDWDDEEQNEEEQDDENDLSFEDFSDEPPQPKQNVLSRFIAWLESGWRSLRLEERKITLADVLRLLICIALAMTLATAGIGLIRFSLTREGALFWLVVTIIIFFLIRKRIFRDF